MEISLQFLRADSEYPKQYPVLNKPIGGCLGAPLENHRVQSHPINPGRVTSAKPTCTGNKFCLHPMPVVPRNLPTLNIQTAVRNNAVVSETN